MINSWKQTIAVGRPNIWMITAAVLVALALLGILLVSPTLAGHLDPGPPSTTLNVQPVQVDGNRTCGELLPAADFLFEFKQEPVEDGSVNLSFDGLSGTLTVDNTGGGTFDFSFSGDFVASAAFVKAGQDGNLYDYRAFGGATADTDLHGPVNPKNNKFYGLSHISFCVGQGHDHDGHDGHDGHVPHH